MPPRVQDGPGRTLAFQNIVIMLRNHDQYTTTCRGRHGYIVVTTLRGQFVEPARQTFPTFFNCHTRNITQ